MMDHGFIEGVKSSLLPLLHVRVEVKGLRGARAAALPPVEN